MKEKTKTSKSKHSRKSKKYGYKINGSAKEIQLVILMSQSSLGISPLDYTQPMCLLSIKQKPALFNIITKLVKNGLEEVVFVVNRHNKPIIEIFMEKNYPRLRVKYVVQKEYKNTVFSLKLCEKYITKPFVLLNGNVICDVNFDFTTSWAAVTSHDGDYFEKLYTRSNKAGFLTYISSEKDYNYQNYEYAVGMYFFSKVSVFKNCLLKSTFVTVNNLDFGTILKFYLSKVPIKKYNIEYYYNTNTVSGLVDSLRNNMSGRSFNNFNINEYGVITKTSTEKKLLSEINWYTEIGKTPLALLCPHFLGRKGDANTYSYQLEYMDYTSLAEYFVYYPISDTQWKYIFETLLVFANSLWNYEKAPETFAIEQNATKMYLDKTNERVAKWERQDLLNLEMVIVNNKPLHGFRYCWNALQEKLAEIIDESRKYSGVIHGDLCFGNILYAPKSSIFKFIDPRGNFGEDSIFGDIRYDIAKLRHSYHGLFDYITSDLFVIEQQAPNKFDYKFLTNKIPNYNLFDNILLDNGVDIDKIELLEGILFISMIPLHSDSKERQLMFFFQALQCFNSQLNN